MLVDFENNEFLITLTEEKDWEFIKTFLSRKPFDENNNAFQIHKLEAYSFLSIDYPFEFSPESSKRLEMYQKVLDVSNCLKGVEPFKVFENIPKFQGQLQPHQHNAVYGLSIPHGFLINDPTGTGKTISTIAAICQHQDFSIIVCEAGKADDWLKETQKFSELNVINLQNREPKYRKSFYNNWESNKYDVIIINYELVKKDILFLCHISRQQKTRIYADESTKIRNPFTDNNRMICKLGDHCIGRYALNATSFEKDLVDLYGVFCFLIPGLFGNLQRFDEMFCRRHAVYQTIMGHKNVELFKKKIYPFWISRSKSDINRLNGVKNKKFKHFLHLVEPSDNLLKFDQKIESEIQDIKNDIKKAKSTNDYKKIQELSNAKFRLTTRRIRACISLRLLGFDEQENDKYLELCKIIESYQEEGYKAVVFSRWVETINWITGLNPPFTYDVAIGGQKGKYNVGKVVERFNKNDKQVLLCSDAVRRGFNIPSANVIIHLDMPKNAATFEQRNGRIDREAIDKKMFFHYIITKEPTIEYYLYEGMMRNVEISLKLYEQNKSEMPKVQQMNLELKNENLIEKIK